MVYLFHREIKENVIAYFFSHNPDLFFPPETQVYISKSVTTARYKLTKHVRIVRKHEKKCLTPFFSELK